jgi:hypothetical protein
MEKSTLRPRAQGQEVSGRNDELGPEKTGFGVVEVSDPSPEKSGQSMKNVCGN